METCAVCGKTLATRERAVGLCTDCQAAPLPWECEACGRPLVGHSVSGLCEECDGDENE